ncbi:hypothetical protein E2C01_019830 [Portunus trituberculatus]|uniref:Uncharacterized protein n=1 Tax=Portunus trituberculatus TaxID=210409 RepID=A0A5B7E0G7_PORTR|nr:hypothetical protein [Portunus trituberculatus]
MDQSVKQEQEARLQHQARQARGAHTPQDYHSCAGVALTTNSCVSVSVVHYAASRVSQSAAAQWTKTIQVNMLASERNTKLGDSLLVSKSKAVFECLGKAP